MNSDDHIRHSKAQEAEVELDAEGIARREAANALRQADLVVRLIREAVEQGTFKLRPSTVLALNAEAVEGLTKYAGLWRPGQVAIGKSEHTPPDARSVPFLVEEMCDYVNDSWKTRSAIHLSSFIMWRLNWIHPFFDGNGRTSRATSYLVLCARLGSVLPGSRTIPEQISANRIPYYDSLEAADKRYASAKQFGPDTVQDMEALLSSMLAAQLKSAFDDATTAADWSSKDVIPDPSRRMIEELGENSMKTRIAVDEANEALRGTIDRLLGGRERE
jgi:fido (protein-threonine AMPylation protein)